MQWIGKDKLKTHLNAFIARYSISCHGNLTSSLSVWNDKARLSAFRLNTLSIKAINETFWRKNG